MIRLCFDPVFVQTHCEILSTVSALAIDDAAVVSMRLHKAQQLLVGAIFRLHAISEIGPIETGDITTWPSQAKLLDDIGLHSPGRSGGERHQRCRWKELAQLSKLAILRPKVMAPLANAMRLVNRDQTHRPLLQVGQKAR